MKLLLTLEAKEQARDYAKILGVRHDSLSNGQAGI